MTRLGHEVITLIKINTLCFSGYVTVGDESGGTESQPLCIKIAVFRGV